MKYRIVFVTDGTTEAVHADHGYYDGLVQAEADANGLGKNPQPVTWLALISSRDGTKATERLPVDGVPIYLLSGDQVATGTSSLWDPQSVGQRLLRPIDQSPTALGDRPGSDRTHRKQCQQKPPGRRLSPGTRGLHHRARHVLHRLRDVAEAEQMRLVAFSQVSRSGSGKANSEMPTSWVT